MNERIKELYEQSLIRETGKDHAGNPMLVIKQNPEKFAELIVKECGQWFNNRLVVEPDYGMEHRIERNRAVVGVMKEYNTHFGVEE